MNSQPLTPHVIEATALLLDDIYWRRRVVEKVTPLTTDHYQLRRSFQFEIPTEPLADLADLGQVEVLLPVCWMPKESLLEFDLADAHGQPLPVIDRETNALVVGEILDAWRQESGIALDSGLDTVTIVRVCQSSLAQWYQSDADVDSQDPGSVLRHYYEELLGLLVPPWECDQLFATGEQAESAVRRQLADRETIQHHRVTMLNTAVLAPLIRRIDSREELAATVQELAAIFESTATMAAKHIEGPAWLDLFARASAEWPVLTPMTLMLGETVLIKTVEVRKSGDRKPRVVRHRADMSAALSYHLVIHAPEPSIRIAQDPVVVDSDGNELGQPGVFDGARRTDELFSAYSSSIDRPSRPRHADVTITYKLYPSSVVAEIYALALTIIALAVVAATHNSVDTTFAAVLLIPTTVVAGFIGTRGSVLVSAFLWRYRVTLLVLNIFLWIWVLSIVGKALEGN